MRFSSRMRRRRTSGISGNGFASDNVDAHIIIVIPTIAMDAARFNPALAQERAILRAAHFECALKLAHLYSLNSHAGRTPDRL